eukprot:CAMPEP_0184429518 /NCGR_PEP_ID=MMETSP0738-20130409/241415_1 /TAXON_ID=385413 /ORGANISM="Thalassiosira miniscula, Strain CCMP1093" /LENGTH=72 /DNA_ID=CAMNT_0026793781 /DNA_START=26 /DNA_END=244 /DNA_ORIENTATION=-
MSLLEIPLGQLDSAANDGKIILVLENLAADNAGGDKFDFRSRQFASFFAEDSSVPDTPPKLICVPVSSSPRD